MKTIEKQYDVVVVGGGMSGVCAAISAARNGAKTVLVQNRPVLGGNASSEVKVSVNGAGRHIGFRNAMESGVILELLMRNKYINSHYSFHVMDTVTWDMVKTQEGLDLYLSTQMVEATCENNVIKSITALQTTTNTQYIFKGEQFIDTTGDANLAYESGADWTIGREGKDVYGESLAPDESDGFTMGSTILYEAKHTGKPTTFVRPSWAYELTEEMIGGRNIHEVDDGYWWIEVGGDDLKVIEDAEDIRDELIKYAYGAFDYVKNSGKYPEAYDIVMTWIAPIPGKRESRRIYGDYVLNQNDCYEGCRFEDAVAYGGWSMDDHTSGGIRGTIKKNNKKEEGSIWHEIKDIYTIPYRSLYSRNVENLYVGGRAISGSHMAMSSTRVIGTCAVIGQAVGTAAAIAHKYGTNARGVNEHMHELQQTLIRDDAYIPGIATKDTQDLVSNMNCAITASSCVTGGEPTNINGEYARRVGAVQNAWISDNMDKGAEWLQVSFPEVVSVKDVLLRFDPNFSKLLTPTIAVKQHKDMPVHMPEELVRDYEVICMKDGVEVACKVVDENYLRVNKLHFEEAVECDSIKVVVKKTYGDTSARIFEVRAYS
ncbi:MAG: FAD-dependent oxidoreductase [Lachnospiraceae bacterium]